MGGGGRCRVGVGGGGVSAKKVDDCEWAQRPYIIETMHSYTLPM